MYPLLHSTIAAVSAADGWMRDEQNDPCGRLMTAVSSVGEIPCSLHV